MIQGNTFLQPMPTVGADNGVSIDTGSSNVVLGQDVGDPGNPAILLSPREIPTAGNDVLMTGTGNLLLNKTVSTGEKLQLVGGMKAENGFSARIQLDPSPVGNIDIITAFGTITLNGNSAVLSILLDNIIAAINAPGHFDVTQGGVALMRVLGTGNVMINSIVDNGNRLQVNGSISQNDPAAMIHAVIGMNNGAAAAAGTLLNAPAAGNPTKWIPFDDAGTTRFIPAW
jgi:hypothetical protein